MKRDFAFFLIVGGIGFVSDLSILLLLLHFKFADEIGSRIVSFSVALTITWLLNRHVTFRSRKTPHKTKEWLRYALTNGIGGAINFAIYAYLVTTEINILNSPTIALMTASALALIFNFTGNRIFVFNQSVSDQN